MMQEIPSQMNEAPCRTAHLKSTGCFFLLVPPRKVLSVETGKIPTNKVKVRVKTSHLAVGWSTFTFLVGILSSSTLRTFLGGTSKKKHPVKSVSSYFVPTISSIITQGKPKSADMLPFCNLVTTDIGLFVCVENKIDWKI